MLGREDHGKHTYKGDAIEQQVYFEKMLKAMYCKEYNIADANELIGIVDMADYYRTLPAVSRSIVGVLSISPVLAAAIYKEPTKLLHAAYKLHHKALFNDCFVHAVGLYESEGKIEEYGQEEFNDIIEIGHARLCIELVKLEKRLQAIEKHDCLLDLRKHHHDIHNNSQKIIVPSFWCEASNRQKALLEKTSLPHFYHLWQYNEEVGIDVFLAIAKIRARRLELDTKGAFQSGVGIFQDRFLCAKMFDHEFPWDLEATQW